MSSEKEYCIMGKIWGGKLSQMSHFCGYLRKIFTAKFGGVMSFGTAWARNPWKFSPSKVSCYTVTPACTFDALTSSPGNFYETLMHPATCSGLPHNALHSPSIYIYISACRTYVRHFVNASWHSFNLKMRMSIRIGRAVWAEYQKEHVVEE